MLAAATRATFGPFPVPGAVRALVLIPQVLTARGGSVVHAGLLSALPAGSGWPP